jgi:hypothetical protein
MKRNRSDQLLVDLAKVMSIVAWVWLFSVWVDAKGSPRRMVDALEDTVRRIGVSYLRIEPARHDAWADQASLGRVREAR